MDREISRFLLRLRREHPFLASLSLFADFVFTQHVDRFDTDGRTIRLEPDYFHALAEEEKPGILLHLVLHCALLHAVRRKTRDENVWNVAADIAANNIILEGNCFGPPADTVTDSRYAGYSTEQIYEALRQKLGGEDGGEGDDEPRDHHGCCYHKDLAADAGLDPKEHLQRLQQHWNSAIHRAEAADRMTGKTRGDLTAGLAREVAAVRAPMLDWRTQLWRHVVQTPCDFAGFDRRHVHNGLYLEALTGESVKVDVVVDTSGSIDEEELRQFISEVRSIANAYEHVKARLYYADAAVYGPYPLHKFDKLGTPTGGGGTDFSTFFDSTHEDANVLEPPLCVYFTDGDGHFPHRPPKRPVLWVVTAGGRLESEFPFGDVARMGYV